MDGWQPIETAPKDGTEVDLFLTTGREPDCFWKDGGWTRTVKDGDYMGEDGVQIEYPKCNIVATHWMPLPSPPDPLLKLD